MNFTITHTYTFEIGGKTKSQLLKGLGIPGHHLYTWCPRGSWGDLGGISPSKEKTTITFAIVKMKATTEESYPYLVESAMREKGIRMVTITEFVSFLEVVGKKERKKILRSLKKNGMVPAIWCYNGEWELEDIGIISYQLNLDKIEEVVFRWTPDFGSWPGGILAVKIT